MHKISLKGYTSTEVTFEEWKLGGKVKGLLLWTFLKLILL